MAKVSICIPCYQHLDNVANLLESIQKQTYQDIEVIITDDTETDEIGLYIENIRDAEFRKKIKYQHNSNKLGFIFNWNEALSRASGELIKIMFSDDWFTFEDSLAKMVEMLEQNPGASIAFTGTRQVSTGRTRERYASDLFIERLREDARNLFLGNEIGAPSATIYRRCGVMFDEKSNWASDMFLYFDILQQNGNFAYTREPLISIGESDEQYTYTFSDTDERKYQDYKYMYEKYYLRDSKSCRQYFLEQFLVPYDKSPVEVKRAGISCMQAFVYAWKTHKKYFLRCWRK